MEKSDLPIVMDNLTVVIPFRNGHAELARLLGDLPPSLSVVVVDDQSNPPLHLDRRNTKVVCLGERGYFAGAVNAGFEACDTDVLILNQDARLSGMAWLDLLERERGEYAVIGDAVFANRAWPKGYVQGTFMFVRRDAWRKVGGLNRRDYPLWGCTCEWQLRACRAGYRALPLRSVPGLSHHGKRRQRHGKAITQALRAEPEKRGLFIRTPPAVSVVIPCYDYGRFLPDAVNSLVGGPTSLGMMPPQTFQSFEVIIVDDASTDGTTREVGAALADDWKAIRHVQLKRNRGTPGALNAGIRAAVGRYITVLSADDMREPWGLEKLYRACEANPEKFAYDDCTFFSDDHRDRVWHAPEYNFQRLLKKNYIHAGAMYPKAAWLDVGGYPEEMQHGREDWGFNIALGEAGWHGVRVPRAGYLYRKGGEGAANRTLRNCGPKWRKFFQNQVRVLFPEAYGLQ